MKITVRAEGFDKYLDKLSSLGYDAIEIVDRAVYDGAHLMADNVKQALETIPVDTMKKVPFRKSINRIQKEGLLESYGIAPLRADGDFRNVKIGFDGYNNFITFKHPHGQPNAMIARSLESGTSFMPKNPVISRATRANKVACENAMGKSIEDACKKIFY